VKNLEFNTTLLDQYINILSKLSSKARKYLIDKLEESLENQQPKPDKNQDMFGAWTSNETANELIEKINNSRSFNRKIEEL